MCGQTTQIPPRPSESPFDPIKHSSLLIPSANHIICCDHVDRQLMQEYQNLPIEKNQYLPVSNDAVLFHYFFTR